ncbi:MAG: glycosyltransferase involved in cell wall biosynthesis [Flavobacteriales bacterium]|jgi:glycosyltransferase involved in cell wall biosynthesis
MSNKVSVIVPCYNQALYLDETLQSVLEQTHTNWECIIIDDGSTDDSKAIALRWCSIDNRFSYFYQPNGGLSKARNAGLRIAKGEYIQFLDGDDLLVASKFENQLIDLQDSQVSISNYFSFLDGDKNSEAPHRYLTPFVSDTNFKTEIILDWEYRISIPCHAVLFQRKLAIDHHIFFNESLPNHEDWVFWVQIFYKANTIKTIGKVLALYRIRINSMSADYALMRNGFHAAADILLHYFSDRNDKELVQAVRIKKHELKNRNKKSFLKKMKSILSTKLRFIYHYVKSN